jgi:RNA polymerase sigma factor (sigma-70 family)
MSVTREDMRVVERVASRFVRRGVSSERDDLISDGMLELVDAVKTWESDRGLREDWSGGRDQVLFGRVRLALIDGLRLRNGRVGSGYAKQRFRENTDSLDVSVQHRGAGHTNESMIDRFVGELDRDLEDVGVMEMLEWLPTREREIIERSVFGDETEKEIGRSMGISETRVSQIRSRGLSRLRGENVPVTQEPKKTSLLSEREVEILQGIANDLNNREIAKKLGVSVETVKSHLRKVHTRFDCKSRAGAVAIGMRVGLIR